MNDINQGFGLAQLKEEGGYINFRRYGDSIDPEPKIRTQEDYMWGVYPTVAKLIEQLSSMNPNAKVCYYYDSHIHGSINMIYESKGGAVILTSDDEMRSMKEYDRPKDETS